MAFEEDIGSEEDDVMVEGLKTKGEYATTVDEVAATELKTKGDVGD